MRVHSKIHLFVSVAIVGLLFSSGASARAQELGGAGTIQGTVKDATGGVMVSASVSLSNPVSGFRRDSTTDEAGRFSFRNMPPNPYHLEITAQGFQPIETRRRGSLLGAGRH